MYDIIKVFLIVLGLFLMSFYSWGFILGQVKFLLIDILLNWVFFLFLDYVDFSVVYVEVVLRIVIDDNVDFLFFKFNQLLGYVYYYKGDYRKLNFFYKKILGIQYIVIYFQVVVFVYNNIGINYEILDEYDKVIDIYLQFIFVEEFIGNMDGKYMIWINLSILFVKINDIKEVKCYVRGVLWYFESCQDSI